MGKYNKHEAEEIESDYIMHMDLMDYPEAIKMVRKYPYLVNKHIPPTFMNYYHGDNFFKDIFEAYMQCHNSKPEYNCCDCITEILNFGYIPLEADYGDREICNACHIKMLQAVIRGTFNEPERKPTDYKMMCCDDLF